MSRDRLARSIWVLAACLLSGFIATGARAQAQTMVDSPQAWELETSQAGGTGVGQYKSVGALRCKAPGQAVVGARILRSDVVDSIQIGCSTVECSDDAECKWGKLDRAAGAGEPRKESLPSIAVCPHDRIVSGYRARVKVVKQNGSRDYVSDLQFECARITGPPVGFGDKGPDAGLPVSNVDRSWIPFPMAAPPGPTSGSGAAGSNGAATKSAVPVPSATAPVSETSDPASDGSPWPVEAHCAGRGASALSVGVGRYGSGGASVIQALSMFCVRAPPSAGAVLIN